MKRTTERGNDLNTREGFEAEIEAVKAEAEEEAGASIPREIPEMPETSEATTLPEEAIEEPAEDPGYTVGSWKALPNYECRDCPFATLHREEIEKHRADLHAPPPPWMAHWPNVRKPSGLVDEQGNPL